MKTKEERVAAVIVAAGMSTRMQEFKQLMEIGGTTMAERVVMNFQKAGVRDIVMVTGYRAEDVERVLAKHHIAFVRNERYAESQMLDSAKLGFSYLQGSANRVFFCPVDVPFFLDATVKRMMETEGNIVMPMYQGRTGHPILLDKSLIPLILSYEGERGLKGALESSGETIIKTEVADEGSLLDADTRQEYERLVEFHNRNLMRAEAKVTLSGANSFFDPATMTLLRQIDRIGNVREACERSGISYSKGWKIIRSLESGLQCKLVDRVQGGKSGGSAKVTDECRKWMQIYDNLEQEVSRFAQDTFATLYQEGFSEK